ncbi:MAG: glycerate kinase, partial [Spirochaetales bacterium]|nr:glycerate kinase [Spirochaetales bacterium]
RRAKKLDKKVLAFVGDIGDSVEKAYEEGVTGIFSINRVAVSYLEARERAMDDLFLTVDNVIRCIKAF